MGASNSKIAFKQAVVQLILGEAPTETSNPSDPFSAFWTLPDSAEDIYSLFLTKDIQRLQHEKPERLKGLWMSILTEFNRLSIRPIPKEETTSTTEASLRSLLNCVRLITRLLPFLFDPKTPSLSPTSSSEASLTTVLSMDHDYLMTPLEESTNSMLCTAPPYQFLLDHLVRLMYFEHLTLPSHSFPSFQHPGAFHPFPQDIHWQSFVWQHGSRSLPSYSFVDSRIDILRCFLVLLSKSMYFTPHQNVFQNEILDFFTSQTHPDQAKLLFFSWLRTLTSFRKSSVPYDYLLFKNHEQSMALLCLQLLCVVLTFPNDETNVFHQLLKNEQLDWVPYIEQCIYLLQARNSSMLLPGATSAVFFYHEILIFFYIMIHTCKRFADTIDAKELTDPLVIELLDILQNHTSVEELNLFRISIFILSSISLKNTTYCNKIINTLHDLIASRVDYMVQFYEPFLSIFRKLLYFQHPLDSTSSRCIFNLFRVWSIPSYLSSSELNWKLPALLCETIELALQNKDDAMIEHVLDHRLGLSEFLWLKLDKLVMPLVGKGKERLNVNVWEPTQAWLTQWRSTLHVPLLEHLSSIELHDEQAMTKESILQMLVTHSSSALNSHLVTLPYSRCIPLNLRYWLLSFFWGACYIRSTDSLKSLPLWKGTHPNLFQVKSLSNPPE